MPELTGNYHLNPTLVLPCREVFERGQKSIEVWGAISEVEAEIVKLHEGFWT